MERGNLGELDIDRRILSKWLFKNWFSMVWEGMTGLIWQWMGHVVGSYECDREL
jgi:hypothetical protein